MPQPFKHPKTGVYYFRKVIPVALRETIGKSEWRESLKTKDIREAKRLYPEVALKVDAQLAQAAQGGSPISLTHKQIAALAGHWYADQVGMFEDNPGNPDHIDASLSYLEDAAEDGRAATALAPVVVALLRDAGFLRVDQQSREALTAALVSAQIRFAQTLHRRALGDYSPDPYTATVPPLERPQAPPKPASKAPGKSQTFASLLTAWAAERKPPERTRYEWKRMIGRLAEHVGHDDPERVTKADVVGFKDALLQDGKSGKTVFNHLAAVRALYGWALKNERVKINPASGVGIAAKDVPAERRRPYSDTDARLLLTTARQEKGGRRWVPWLLAFTGARMDEVCQALTTDIRQEAGVWYLDINADDPGKSLKNPGSARKVPLHARVLAEGFLEYVRTLPPGPLFPDVKPDRFGKRSGTFTKVYGRWARSLGITDPRLVAHSWRHRFKDQCRAAGIEKALHDALTGHMSGDVGDGYGLGYPVPVLASAINRLPDQVPD